MAWIRRSQYQYHHDHLLLLPGNGKSSIKHHHHPNPIKWKKLSPFKWCLYSFSLGFLLAALTTPTPPPSPHHHLPQTPALHLKHNSTTTTTLFFETVNLATKQESPPPSSSSEEEGSSWGGLRFSKQLIIVTPTYNRPLQAYFLNRLAQTLTLVPPPLLWIVVEFNSLSPQTSTILSKTPILYRHLVCTTNSTNPKDRGVHQRNTALQHIAHHHLDGILYFADDDNVYSLHLFHSLRLISRFGTWPVAMLAQSKNKAILEGPVCNGSRVIGWHTNEKSKRLRRFHVDMSGFAFNSTILWDPKRWNRTMSNPIRQLDTVKEGFQETTFIEQVVEDEFQMEGIPNGCLRVMNWHLHLEARNIFYPSGWILQKNLDVVLPLEQ